MNAYNRQQNMIMKGKPSNMGYLHSSVWLGGVVVRVSEL